MPRSMDRRGNFEERRDADGKRLYCKQVDIGPHPETGRRRVRRVCAPTKRECLDLADELRARRRRAGGHGGIVEPSTRSLSSWVNEWIAGLEQTADRPGSLRGSTVGGYRSTMRTMVQADAWALGAIPLNRLTPAAVEQHYRDLIVAGRASSSVRLVHTLLRACLDVAVRHGLLPSNPARLARPPRIEVDDKQVWDAEQLAAFLTAPDETFARSSRGARGWLPALRLIALTGMRIGELRGLQWEDIRLDGEMPELIVQRTATVDKDDRPTVGPPKSRGGRRGVPLLPPAVALLMEQRQRQDERRQELERNGYRWPDEGWVFDNGTGRMTHDNSIRRVLAPLCQAAAVPTITPHDLRHTVVTLLAAQDVHPTTVARILGHSVAMTLNTYTHPDAAALRRGIERLLATRDEDRAGSNAPEARLDDDSTPLASR